MYGIFTGYGILRLQVRVGIFILRFETNPNVMARPKGIIKLKGGLGDMSFYEDRRYGPITRRKGGPSKKQIKTSKNCKVVRQNNEEFGRASSAGKLLRQSFYGLINRCSDHKVTPTVQQKLMAVLKADQRHRAGKKILLKEHFGLFGPVELNKACAASTYLTRISRVKEGNVMEVSIEIDCETARRKSASHYRVISSVAVVDFAGDKEVHELQEGDLYKLNREKVEVNFSHVLKGKGIAFHGVCILFYQLVNGEFKLLHDKVLRAGVLEFAEGASQA